jgi:hypothetical protein
MFYWSIHALSVHGISNFEMLVFLQRSCKREKDRAFEPACELHRNGFSNFRAWLNGLGLSCLIFELSRARSSSFTSTLVARPPVLPATLSSSVLAGGTLLPSPSMASAWGALRVVILLINWIDYLSNPLQYFCYDTRPGPVHGPTFAPTQGPQTLGRKHQVYIF